MSYQEVEAAGSLLARLIFDPRTGVLIVLLLIAAVVDYRTHRIPNLLVLCGALFGIAYTTAVPPELPGTVMFSLYGFAAGLALFLPLYIVRAMGAGDVKLLAMVGTFLGPLQTLYAALASVVVGGVLALGFVLVRRRLPRLMQNLGSLLQLGMLGAMAGTASGFRIAPEASAGKLPYGVAIAAGTIGYLALHQLALL